MLKVSPHVSWGAGQGPVTLFDSSDGRYHKLNPTASDVWHMLAAGDDLAAIAAKLARLYGQSTTMVLDEVTALVAQFCALGVIELA